MPLPDIVHKCSDGAASQSKDVAQSNLSKQSKDGVGFKIVVAPPPVDPDGYHPSQHEEEDDQR
jgi:hypothetical protein